MQVFGSQKKKGTKNDRKEGRLKTFKQYQTLQDMSWPYMDSQLKFVKKVDNSEANKEEKGSTRSWV